MPPGARSRCVSLLLAGLELTPLPLPPCRPAGSTCSRRSALVSSPPSPAPSSPARSRPSSALSPASPPPSSSSRPGPTASSAQSACATSSSSVSPRSHLGRRFRERQADSCAPSPPARLPPPGLVAVGFILASLKRIQPHVLLACTCIVGAFVVVLGADCFASAGLKCVDISPRSSTRGRCADSS